METEQITFMHVCYAHRILRTITGFLEPHEHSVAVTVNSDNKCPLFYTSFEYFSILILRHYLIYFSIIIILLAVNYNNNNNYRYLNNLFIIVHIKYA